jgi:NAD(P)-dependent dehydrogenase (short-subunit alcohol dehydrogenase family)
VGELAGKVAIVTGGASGIGHATVELLAERDAQVVVVDKDAAPSGLLLTADLAQPDEITRCVDEVLARLGRIDILVNCAGVTSDDPLLTMSLDAWDRIHAVNLRAAFLLIQGVGRHMVERGGGGRIVNVSSSSAFRAERTNAAYAASKAGIVALTRTAAAELGRHGINVNAVAPGLTRTPMTEPYLGDDDGFEDAVRAGPLANLLHRVSTPADVAAVIVFLCLDASRQITAQTIHTSAGAVV